jgi:hypothetical protein
MSFKLLEERNMAEDKIHNYSDEISKVSPYGFMLEQHVADGQWLNYGKFYEGKKNWAEGDKVEVEVQEKHVGEKVYWNIRAVSLANGNSIPANATISSGTETDRQILIVRQSSWDKAIAYANANKMKDLGEIQEVAHYIEEDVFRPQKFKDDVPF